MDYDLWDLNSLTIEDLESLKEFKTVSGLPFQEALLQWNEKNPGKLQKVGEIRKGEIISNEITPDGVKEIRGADVFKKIIENHKRKQDDKHD